METAENLLSAKVISPIQKLGKVTTEHVIQTAVVAGLLFCAEEYCSSLENELNRKLPKVSRIVFAHLSRLCAGELLAHTLQSLEYAITLTNNKHIILAEQQQRIAEIIRSSVTMYEDARLTPLLEHAGDKIRGYNKALFE